MGKMKNKTRMMKVPEAAVVLLEDAMMTVKQIPVMKISPQMMKTKKTTIKHKN